MKMLCLMGLMVLLSACATPKPIVDTAAIVTRMSNDMDSTVSSYAKSLKTLRQADLSRLQALRADAERRRREPDDEIQIMTLAEDTRPLKVLNALTALPVPDPLHSVVASKSDKVPPVSFDGASLKALASITADIAQPRGALEQLKALFAFAQTVNADLQKAATENEKPATP